MIGLLHLHEGGPIGHCALHRRMMLWISRDGDATNQRIGKSQPRIYIFWQATRNDIVGEEILANVTSSRSQLPAGGGAFDLPDTTIGIFRNDQPGHRLSVGKDQQMAQPLTANQGWILPAGANGICEYDAPLDVLTVAIPGTFLAETGMADVDQFDPIVGDLDPLVVQLAMTLETASGQGRLYLESLERALAAQLTNTLAYKGVSGFAAIADGRLRRVLSYINDNLAEDISLTGMADVAAMSPHHFSRAFKKATGHSPIQYVLAERLAMAKLLLKTTKLTVSEICFRVGYQDLSRFGQHFKRATGITPATYRDH